MKTWSSTQDPLALSSCEAEYYAMVEGAMEVAKGKLGTVVDGATRVLGTQVAAKELGIAVDDITVEVATDSSSAKSFASRRGSGRIRHVDVKWLWLQQAVANGRFKLKKVLGTMNPADVCTKYLPLREVKEKLGGVNVELKEAVGRRGIGDRVMAGHAEGHQRRSGVSGGVRRHCGAEVEVEDRAASSADEAASWLRMVQPEGARRRWADAFESESGDEADRSQRDRSEGGVLGERSLELAETLAWP